LKLPFRKIVVVGGGTAGWLSAAYLQRVIGSNPALPVSIDVIESDDVGIIGVGEATIPSIRQTLQVLGIPEWQLFAETDATFKNGIRFLNWSQPQHQGGSEYFHPFEWPPVHEGYNATTHWLVAREAGVKVPRLDQAVGVQSALSEGMLSPKLFSSRPYEAPIPYAYHLDAVKFGRLLRDVATSRGVNHIVDHVEQVILGGDGEIAELRTRDGRVVQGDLFIDCTGFLALLIEQALGEPWIDYGDWLLCDRAVACQVPHGTQPSLRSFTTATAVEAGWLWEIDLFGRSGIGYVYSSRFSDQERAQRILAEHLGKPPDELKFRNLAMRVGRHRNVWSKNCLAVGLSAGFIEPLESTGIHLIEIALSLFVDYMAHPAGIDRIRQAYNDVFRRYFDELRDFILLHYLSNQRNDEPFWDHYRSAVPIPESLRKLLTLWMFKLPTGTDLSDKVSIFGAPSYTYVHLGMGNVPPFGQGISPYIPIKSSIEFLKGIQDARQQAVKGSPPQIDLVRKLRGVAG
jgi:tryptophan 7-halogenase